LPASNAYPSRVARQLDTADNQAPSQPPTGSAPTFHHASTIYLFLFFQIVDPCSSWLTLINAAACRAHNGSVACLPQRLYMTCCARASSSPIMLHSAPLTWPFICDLKLPLPSKTTEIA
jgi:hypothetical protein